MLPQVLLPVLLLLSSGPADPLPAGTSPAPATPAPATQGMQAAPADAPDVAPGSAPSRGRTRCPPCSCVESADSGPRELEAAPGPRRDGAQPAATELVPLRRADRDVQQAPAPGAAALSDPFMPRPWPRNEHPAPPATVLRVVL